jgi:hypothetical protein
MEKTRVLGLEGPAPGTGLGVAVKRGVRRRVRTEEAVVGRSSCREVGWSGEGVKVDLGRYGGAGFGEGVRD